jgi:hypothetical protein
MSKIQNTKRSGYLFIASGCMFFLVTILAHRPAFYGFFGIALAYIVIGATMLRKAKRE